MIATYPLRNIFLKMPKQGTRMITERDFFPRHEDLPEHKTAGSPGPEKDDYHLGRMIYML